MHIGVLTSGGDSPGMNAAIRSIVKVGVGRGHEVVGVQNGWAGVLAAEARPLTLADVDGISRQGGTVLGSARSKIFPTVEGQRQARERIKQLGLDGLIVIGGNGSLTGAHELGKIDAPCKIVGMAASIDNDVGHSGMAIGVDTAVNTIVEACDRISDTAAAHRRVFIVEVMGRQCGYLAMRAGLAAEADAILYAEKQIGEDALVEKLRALIAASFAAGRHKRRVLIVKAEGVKVKTAALVERLGKHLESDVPGVDVRETILGHVVRGGSPTATDRVIAQRLGFAAVGALEEGAHDVMLSWEPPGGFGDKTADPSVRRVGLQDMIDETKRVLDGTSPVTQARLKLLAQVEGLLAL
ncbi:MAG: 6-phosphofructokinase [Deltaproteobacteria bacterium]|nr:6-phosphofructokinase [Deltaproteobacteria bacterium]